MAPQRSLSGSVLLRTCGPASCPRPPQEGSLRHPHGADDDQDNEGERTTPLNCGRRHVLGTYQCCSRFEETDSERCSNLLEVTQQGQGHRSVKNEAKLFPLGCFPATLTLSEALHTCQEIQMILKTCPPCPPEELYLTGAQVPFINGKC